MSLYDDEIKYIPIHVQVAMHIIKTLMDDLLTNVQTKPFSLILLHGCLLSIPQGLKMLFGNSLIEDDLSSAVVVIEDDLSSAVAVRRTTWEYRRLELQG
jgi:hypothetical protein